jgi:catechol 2,3-dioxygenase-like lactoylglutathione lyase family enzyme
MATVRYMVSDVQCAIDFYVGHLGFDTVQEMLPAFASLSRGDLDLWLAGPASSAARAMPDGRAPQSGGWNRFVVEVDDIAALVVRLRAAGVSFRNDVIFGPGGKQVLVDDPDGNPIELFEARK